MATSDAQTGLDSAGTALTDRLEADQVEVMFTSASDQLVVDGVTFETCDFDGVAADGLRFANCEFYDCSFLDCNLTLLVFEDCTFSGSAFRSCKLTGVDWTGMRESSLGHKLRFDACSLDYGYFSGISLKETTFHECSLREADFSGSNLDRAKLVGCDLERARFDHASLREADLRGARNYAIDVRTVDVRKAKVSLPECLDLFDVLELQIAERDDETT